MAVPETAVQEDDRLVLVKNEIRSTGNGLRVQPIAKATGMQRETEYHFRSRVNASDPGHHSGTGLLVDDIRHMAPGLQ